MTVKLLNEHHLEFLSLKGGCTGSSHGSFALFLTLVCLIVLNRDHLYIGFVYTVLMGYVFCCSGWSNIHSNTSKSWNLACMLYHGH